MVKSSLLKVVLLFPLYVVVGKGVGTELILVVAVVFALVPSVDTFMVVEKVGVVLLISLLLFVVVVVVVELFVMIGIGILPPATDGDVDDGNGGLTNGIDANGVDAVVAAATVASCGSLLPLLLPILLSVCVVEIATLLVLCVLTTCAFSGAVEIIGVLVLLLVVVVVVVVGIMIGLFGMDGAIVAVFIAPCSIVLVVEVDATKVPTCCGCCTTG